MIKVLGINGSPRKDGNTSLMINTVLEIAKKEGAETSLIHLVDYPISFCLGCYSKDKNLCNPEVFKEMLPKIYEELINSHAYVFGTPVYWFNVSGLMKNFIDLLTALENVQKILENKVASCVISYEEDGATNAASQIIIPLNFMGVLIPPFAITYARGNLFLKENEDTIKELEIIGKNLVKFARILNENKEGNS
jgi:multimeric flavodoxin WrbA